MYQAEEGGIEVLGGLISNQRTAKHFPEVADVEVSISSICKFAHKGGSALVFAEPLYRVSELRTSSCVRMTTEHQRGVFSRNPRQAYVVNRSRYRGFRALI